jgi:hypothetical protein
VGAGQAPRGRAGAAPRERGGFCYDESVWQRVAARMAARQTRKLTRQGQVFAKHVVPAVVKPARTLWNQFIGFLFCVLGVMFGSKTVQLALDYTKTPASEELGKLLILAVTGFCTALMLWFGVGSFLRARKISRS